MNNPSVTSDISVYVSLVRQYKSTAQCRRTAFHPTSIHITTFHTNEIMSRRILTKANILRLAITPAPRVQNRLLNSNLHTSSTKMASNKLNSETISNITGLEKEVTGKDQPVKGGPTAQAQKHAGETANSSAVSDITRGEQKITGAEGPLKGGPAAMAQSMATSVGFLSPQRTHPFPSLISNRPILQTPPPRASWTRRPFHTSRRPKRS